MHIYLGVAIACLVANGLFMWLANRQAQKDANENLENNLETIFKEMTDKERKNFLSNMNLNKEELITVLNKSSHEIVKELGLIQEGQNQQNEKLENVQEKTSKLLDSKNFYEPSKLELFMYVHFPSSRAGKISPETLNKINSKWFKIWVSFYQNGSEMHAYLDSSGKWVRKGVENSVDDVYNDGVPYIVSNDESTLLITWGKLILHSSNPQAPNFRFGEKLRFKVHYSGYGNLELGKLYLVKFRTESGERFGAMNLKMVEDETLEFDKLRKDEKVESKVIAEGEILIK